jgi:hypothetical protein
MLVSDADGLTPTTRISLRVVGRTSIPAGRQLVRDARGQAVTTVGVVAPRYGAVALADVMYGVRLAIRPFSQHSWVVDPPSAGEVALTYHHPGRCPRVGITVPGADPDALAAARAAQRRFGHDRVSITVFPPGTVFPAGALVQAAAVP